MWKVFADYHTHTKYSHAGGTILENARAAKEKGLEVLGITDHGPANWGHMGTTGLKAFERIMAETKKVEQEISGLRILAGVEADIINYQGELDIPLKLQKKLDLVLAGFHTTIFPKTAYDGLKFITGRTLGYLSPRLKLKARNDNTKAMVEAVYNNEIDIITHPGLNISIDTVELAKACARCDTALEINAKHGVKSVAFIRAAAHEGVKFAINSDAHHPKNVGNLTAGVKAAQVAGLHPEQILNVRQEE